jgi:antitoxin StbD
MNHIGQRIEADLAVSITELKQNPNAVFTAAQMQAVAVLNHNKVIGYIISPEAWEGVLESLDNLHILEELRHQGDAPGVEVSLDDLQADI